MLYQIHLETPLGEMIAISSEQGVCLLEFTDSKNLTQKLAAIQAAFASHHLSYETHSVLLKLQTELSDYFAGSLKTFTVPIDVIGTPFQQSVWQILPTIAYGHTISYAAQAKLLGKPKAVRAVAAANGQNKISIVLPCHRVIGSNGQLTGYAGGLARKLALLDWEKNSVFDAC